MTQNLIQDYIQCRHKSARLKLLNDAKEKNISFPLELVQDFLNFEISEQEKMLLIDRLSDITSIELENFLTSSIPQWSQPLVVIALRTWFERTGCALWYRFLPLIRLESLPQRVRFMLLEMSTKYDGALVTKINTEVSGIEDFSSAFHALILEKCVTHNIKNLRMTQLAEKILMAHSHEPHPSDKAFLSACLYLKKNDLAKLKPLFQSKNISELWHYAIETFPLDKLISHKKFTQTELPLNYQKEYIKFFPADAAIHFSTQTSARSQKLKEIKDLNTLSIEAKKNSGIYTLEYIKLIGNFETDQAVLKLLDYIRSEDEDEINAVIDGLCRIKTERAAQELVSILTRSNSTLIQKLKISQNLKDLPISNLENELRSTIKDLERSTQSATQGSLSFELLDNLKELIGTVATTKIEVAHHDDQQKNFDSRLAAIIPQFNNLSSDVKRALRTAQFFEQTAQNSQLAGDIDMSPQIDMQYKALELFFRENFEEAVNQALGTGTIQRRLDVIGYARPIPEAMEKFEHYLSTLPVINDIPFFSQFKLRKLLRSVCQLHSRKRFTLDGLKAFGLFFLAFSRKDCPFKTEQLLKLDFKSDLQLFEFCRDLHTFQDARNRAAHEGFHPNLKNDQAQLWVKTANIIATASMIKANVVTQRKEVIIERKHAS